MGLREIFDDESVEVALYLQVVRKRSEVYLGAFSNYGHFLINFSKNFNWSQKVRSVLQLVNKIEISHLSIVFLSFFHLFVEVFSNFYHFFRLPSTRFFSFFPYFPQFFYSLDTR